MKMEKVNKAKKLKGKCPNCENKFIAEPSDFFMTENSVWGDLSPMIRCPYCKTYLWKSFGFFGRAIWEEPSWTFKVVKESE